MSIIIKSLIILIFYYRTLNNKNISNFKDEEDSMKPYLYLFYENNQLIQ